MSREMSRRCQGDVKGDVEGDVNSVDGGTAALKTLWGRRVRPAECQGGGAPALKTHVLHR